MGKLKGSDWFLIIFLAILVILTILFSIYPEWGAAFNLSAQTDPDTADYDLSTGLWMVTIACVLGALVPFPVPYTIVVGIVALNFYNKGLGFMMIFLMVIVATVSNAIGDLMDYVIGFIGGLFSKNKENNEKKNKELVTNTDDVEEAMEGNRWAKIINEKPALIPALCFLFGLTPLPDSLLFMPLGLVNYSLKKLMLWNTIGKFFMMGLIALLGVYTFDFLFSILGGSGGENGWISGMVVLFLSWAIMAVMMKKK